MSTAPQRERSAGPKWREGCASDFKMTGPKWREGYASDFKMSTAPERERSDTHKVTIGLREHMLDFHKTLHVQRNMSIEKVKNDVLPRSQPLSSRSTTYCACHVKPEASEVLRLPHGIIIMFQIKFDNGFHKTRFSPFQNVIQVHQTLRLLQKNTSKTISHFDPRLPTRMKKCGRSHSQRFFHFYFILFLFLFFEIENWKNWKHQCLFYFWNYFLGFLRLWNSSFGSFIFWKLFLGFLQLFSKISIFPRII